MPAAQHGRGTAAVTTRVCGSLPFSTHSPRNAQRNPKPWQPADPKSLFPQVASAVARASASLPRNLYSRTRLGQLRPQSGRPDGQRREWASTCPHPSSPSSPSSPPSPPASSGPALSTGSRRDVMPALFCGRLQLQPGAGRRGSALGKRGPHRRWSVAIRTMAVTGPAGTDRAAPCDGRGAVDTPAGGVARRCRREGRSGQ